MENFGTAIWVSKAYAAALYSCEYLGLLQDNQVFYQECQLKLVDLAAELEDQWNNTGAKHDMQLGLLSYSLLPELFEGSPKEAESKSGVFSGGAPETAAFVSAANTTRDPPGHGYPTFPNSLGASSPKKVTTSLRFCL